MDILQPDVRDRTTEVASADEPASTTLPQTSDPAVETCAGCGLPLTRRGAQGECLRCALRLVLEADGRDDDEEAAPAPRPKPAAPPRRYGHFEIQRGFDGELAELGSGAMATTYRALDTVLRLPVALKIIGKHMAHDPDARARFLREARAAARLRHPNVAAVTHYGEQGGECFYAMELVEGETLTERVRRTGVFTPTQALEVGLQVARALAAAEVLGVAHRDIKPSNLMLVGSPAKEGLDGTSTPPGAGELHVKVIDWGLAKAVNADDSLLGADHTCPDGFVGTPAFASPEQFARKRGRRIDTRSDIYSLGVTLWYLLCGQAPFVGDSLDAIHVRQKRLPIAQLAAARVPSHLSEVLRRMLAFDPANRPQSARELLDVLVRCQQRHMGEASTSTRHRRPLQIAALLVLLCLTGAVGVGAWWKSKLNSPMRTAGSKPSLAVLPFEHLSLDASDAFLTTAVQDEVNSDLARVAALNVISAESVRSYQPGRRDLPTIGRELGVRYLLEGSVRRRDDEVQIRVHLSDLRDPDHPWNGTYTRRLNDAFAAQGEITRAVAEHLHATLSDAEKIAINRPPTNDLPAYDLYLRARVGGQVFQSQEQEVHHRLETSIPLLQQAVGRDPQFAFAYAELSNQYIRLVAYEAANGQAEAAATHRLQAEAALAKAVRLRPDAGEVHLARARSFYELNNNYEEAFQELALARHALPNDAEVENLASFLARDRNDWKEAVRCLERNVILDPRDTNQRFTLAVFYRLLRRFAEADRATAQVIASLPRNKSLAYRMFDAIGKLEEWGDLTPLRVVVEGVTADDAPSPEIMAKARLILALYSHDGSGASTLLVDVPPAGLVWGENRLPKAWFEALSARLRHDEAAAQDAFKRARTEQERLLLINPLDGFAMSVLAMIDAGLGDKERAESEARRVLSDPKLMDAASTTAPTAACHAAVVYAWNGRADLACETLEVWTVRPAGDGLVRQPNYGDFLLNPVWDPLRGQPRFEALVARLAPPPDKMAEPPTKP